MTKKLEKHYIFTTLRNFTKWWEWWIFAPKKHPWPWYDGSRVPVLCGWVLILKRTFSCGYYIFYNFGYPFGSGFEVFFKNILEPFRYGSVYFPNSWWFLGIGLLNCMQFGVWLWFEKFSFDSNWHGFYHLTFLHITHYHKTYNTTTKRY